jgi:hypothetical protein
MNTTKILQGYSTQQTAYEVKDYPYGFRLRTSIFYWIESKPGHGDRFCTYTINPKNGRANAPKCSTYSTFKFMYLNEKGHVTCGSIDAYDMDKFVDKFHFIINTFGLTWVNSIQEQNLRDNYRAHILGNFPYQLAKYSEEKKQEAKDWLRETMQHIKECPFESLVEHPDRPAEDNPDGEIKMIVKEYEAPKPLEHSITAEKVQEVLQKVAPKLIFAVTPRKGFEGTEYLKIWIAAPGINGKEVQPVSLSLNLRSLELQPQGYGGEGGQSVYREPNLADPKEKYLAMKSVKIPFRTPARNEKDVLSAVQRFAVNYKNTLLENKDVLKCRELINFELLKTA